MRSPGLLFIGMLAILLCGCASTLKLRAPLNHLSTDVPMFGKIPSRMFLDSSLFTFPLSVAWQYDASAGFGNGSPIVAGNILFMGTMQGELHAVDIETGKKISYMKTYSPVSSSPVIFNKYLIVGTESNNENLLCIDTDDGEIRWSKNLGGVASSPMVEDSLLFAGGLDGKFYCLEAAYGTKKWIFDAENPIRSSPCAWGDLVFCANTRGTVFALEKNTGVLRWKFGTNNAVFAGLTASQGRLFVASRDSNLYIFDAVTGAVDKKIPVGNKIMSAPAVDENNVFVPSLDGSLLAFSLSDGTLRWKFQSKSAINTTPIVTPTAIFVASLDQRLYAVSPFDGTVLWYHDFESRIKTTPLVWKNSVIIAAEDKTIYLFR